MRAFGALRGFPFFGRNSFKRQQQRQQGNKASQAGGQPLSNGPSTTVRSGQRASEESLLILPSFSMATPECTSHVLPHHPMPAIKGCVHAAVLADTSCHESGLHFW